MAFLDGPFDGGGNGGSGSGSASLTILLGQRDYTWVQAMVSANAAVFMSWGYDIVGDPLDQERAEGYVAWTYGAQYSLPADHRYAYPKESGSTFGAVYYRPWTPAHSSYTKYAWWDAQTTSDFVLNGFNVSVWADRSGNNCNASQGTVNSQPLYNPTGWNGYPCVEFDGYNAGTGVSRYLNIGTPSFAGIYPTVFMNLRVDPDDADGVVGTNYCFAMSLGAYLVGGYSFDIHPTGLWAGKPIAKGTQNLYVNDKLGGGGRLNGAPWYTGAIPSHTSSSLGYSGAAYALKGRLSEVLAVDGTMPLSEVQKVEGYLAWKWGDQANLPADHPYYTQPPLDNTSIGLGRANGRNAGVVDLRSHSSLAGSTLTITGGKVCLRGVRGNLNELSVPGVDLDISSTPEGQLNWVVAGWTDANQSAAFVQTLAEWPNSWTELQKYAVLGRYGKMNGALETYPNNISLSADIHADKIGVGYTQPSKNISLGLVPDTNTAFLRFTAGSHARWPGVADFVTGSHEDVNPSVLTITEAWIHLRGLNAVYYVNGVNAQATYLLGKYDSGLATPTNGNPGKCYVHTVGRYASSNKVVIILGQVEYGTVSDAVQYSRVHKPILASWAADGRQITWVGQVVFQTGQTAFAANGVNCQIIPVPGFTI